MPEGVIVPEEVVRDGDRGKEGLVVAAFVVEVTGMEVMPEDSCVRVEGGPGWVLDMLEQVPSSLHACPAAQTLQGEFRLHDTGAVQQTVPGS